MKKVINKKQVLSEDKIKDISSAYYELAGFKSLIKEIGHSDQELVISLGRAEEKFSTVGIMTMVELEEGLTDTQLMTDPNAKWECNFTSGEFTYQYTEKL